MNDAWDELAGICGGTWEGLTWLLWEAGRLWLAGATGRLGLGLALGLAAGLAAGNAAARLEARRTGRVVGFGDLDEEHGEPGPRFGSDETDW